jgi:hypothetical protein
VCFIAVCVCVFSLNAGAVTANLVCGRVRACLLSHPAEATGLNMWYSFNYANVHFVSFDTESDYYDSPASDQGDDDTDTIPFGGFAPSGEQVAWLERDLQAVRRNAALAVRPVGQRSA